MFNASLPAALSLVVLLAQALPGQQPRDAPPPSAKAGTAAIRGRVFNLETGLLIRRASVMLMVMPTTPARPPSGGGPVVVPLAQAQVQAGAGRGGGARAVRTDQAGRFEFTGLTAGTYRLRVSPNQNTGAYLGSAYGASDSREPGKVIELKEGQQFDTADVPLQRGGAVTGRIIDDGGDPLSRVNVYVSRTTPGGQGFQRTGGGLIQSDDHGRYRIYGLEPGDYIVTAETRGMGGPPVDDPEPEGFVATHHPGTASQRDAVRVRVRAGLDADGIDIQMIRTRTFRITGTIMDSQGRPAQRVNAMFVMPTGGGFSSNGVSMDPQGRFTIRDVVPGEYILVVRPGGMNFGEPPGVTPSPAPPSPAPQEHAIVPLSVGADIENLVVVTQPGVTVAGQVVFADGDPGGKAESLRVSAQPGNRMQMFGPPPTATVDAQNRFTLTGLFGPQLIRVLVTSRTWALQAIMLGATDITETPVEFRKEHSGHLQIVLTTRTATIEGTVTGDDGVPIDQIAILVFPEDKASWRFGSPRVRTGMSLKEGRFSVTGLVAGRYFAIAMPPRDMMMTPDMSPEYFEGLAKDATRVVVAEDERRVVDLRVSKPPQ